MTINVFNIKIGLMTNTICEVVDLMAGQCNGSKPLILHKMEDMDCSHSGRSTTIDK